MKKILCATIIVLALLLAGCGNMEFGPGNYDFNIVHVCDHAGNYRDYGITSWHDNETGVEVKLTDGNSLFLSEGTYILAEDYCPLCGGAH